MLTSMYSFIVVVVVVVRRTFFYLRRRYFKGTRSTQILVVLQREQFVTVNH